MEKNRKKAAYRSPELKELCFEKNVIATSNELPVNPNPEDPFKMG